MAMRRIRTITDEAAKHSLTRSAVGAYPLCGRVRQGGTTMELIQLTPHSQVDPSQPLRAPGDILLHAYLIPNALNPAQLARRTGIPAHHIKAFIADTHPITPKTALRLSLIFDTTAFYWLALQARYDLERAKPVVRAYRPLVD
jgi:addiction module HigA family antidote